MKGEELVLRFDDVRRLIRKLHLEIYYRPMLPEFTQLDDQYVSLSQEAAIDRYASIGFQDPPTALRRVETLTSGISRAAAINRVLLPTVLWLLSQGQNPDMGLLAWQRLEEKFGAHSDYLGFLRDSAQTAGRLCHVLSNSRYLGDALYQSSESVRWLADDEELHPRSRKSLDIQTAVSLNRFSSDKAGFLIQWARDYISIHILD